MDKYYGEIAIMWKLLKKHEHKTVIDCQKYRSTNLFALYFGKSINIDILQFIISGFTQPKDRTWDWIYKKDGTLLVLAFNDKEIVYFLSNVWNYYGYLR